MDTVDALGAVIVLITFVVGWLSRSPLMISYEERDGEILRVKRSLDLVSGKLFMEMRQAIGSIENLPDSSLKSMLHDHSITLLSDPHAFRSLERARKLH